MTIQRLSESYAEKLYGDKWKHDNNALAARYAYACGAEEILSILEDCFPTKLSPIKYILNS